MPRFAPRCRLVRLATVALAATAAVPAAAQAAAASGCPGVPLSHPFAPWSDHAPYMLAPDGGVEQGGSAWTLTRGAEVDEGNESFRVGGPADHRSLRLPAGSFATTAPMCIGVEHKSMRFFVKRTAALRDISLDIEVLYSTLDGQPRSKRIGRIPAGRAWAASPILALVVNELTAARGNAMPVSLRLTARGGGFSIDDVYVDPWRSR
jgi:hypothetical protein